MKKSVKIVALIMVMLLIFCSCGKKRSYSDGLDDNGFFTGITAQDYIDIQNMDTIELSQSNIDEQIQALCEAYSTYNETDLTRAVTETDCVNIDYVGKIDGEEFDGGSTDGEGTDVDIANDSFIDGFLEQIVGHKPGDSFTINVTFPDDYSTESLQGKDATFDITINYICEKVIPEFDDDFITTNYYYFYYLYYYYGLSISTADDYIDYLENVAITSYVYANCTLKEDASVPDAVQTWINDTTILSITQYAEQSEGVELITYLKDTYDVETEEEFLELEKEDLEENAETALIIQALAEYYGLSVSDEYLEDYFDDDDDDTITLEEAIKNYGTGYLKEYFLQDVVMEHVKEIAVFK